MVTMHPVPIPGTGGMKWECTLDGMLYTFTLKFKPRGYFAYSFHVLAFFIEGRQRTQRKAMQSQGKHSQYFSAVV